MMGMMWIWPLFLIVVVALCVAGLVWVVQLASRGGTPSAGSTASGGDPLEILQRRYAGGEINQDQFEEMRQTLQQR